MNAGTDIAPERRAKRSFDLDHALSARSWPVGRPRVLVADAWLANGGDGAISLATDRLIRATFPGAAVLHAAYQADLLARHYPGLAFVPPLASLTGAVPGLPEAEGWGEERLRATVEEADIVLSQGGGFLIEHYEPWQRLDAYGAVLDLGTPLGFLAQTIGRFGIEPQRSALARALAGAATISVRDLRSFANVAGLGVAPKRVRVSADQAFTLFPNPPAQRTGAGVAVVLSRETLTGEHGVVGDESGLDELLTEVLVRVARAVEGERVTICSTTQGLGSLDRGLEDDDLFADEVVAGLPASTRAQVRRVRGHIAPLEFARLLPRHRALVSMRMHPLIFALSQGVPSVAITKAHKAMDLLSDLGMPDLAPAWLDVEAIGEATRRAVASDAVRGVELWDLLAPLRLRAGEDSKALTELGAASSHPT